MTVDDAGRVAGVAGEARLIVLCRVGRSPRL